MIGESFSHYRIIERLGKGGMGEVYLTEDTRLRRQVALKVLLPETAADARSIHRFQREARLAAALSHPNIVTVFEVGEHAGIHFVAMEYLEGKTLRQELSGKPLEIEFVFSVALQLIDALIAAHASGIVHRDIKPENIMLLPDRRLKVLDFGLSRMDPLSYGSPAGEDKVTETRLSIADSVSGTVGYMSPEQLRGQVVDARSDLFAVGVVIYEMLAGHGPFSGGPVAESIYQVLAMQPEPLARINHLVPNALERLVHKCLEKDPKRRYQSANNLGADLQALSHGWQTGLVSGGTLPRQIANVRATLRPRRWWWLPAIAVVTVLAIVLFSLRSSPQLNSIVFLPFENSSGDSSLDRVADLLSDSIRRDLARLPGLSVAPFSLTARYSGPNVEPLAAVRKLRVHAILTGKIKLREGNIEADLELIDAGRGTEIWSQNHLRRATELSSLENDLWADIALSVRPKLSLEPQHPRQPPKDSQAYQLYLTGQDELRHPGAHQTELAIRNFQQATEKERNFTGAYAGLAQAYVSIANYGIQPPATVLPQAISAARRALELDPNIPEANASYAFAIAASDFDWTGAERWFRRAIELDPNFARAHSQFALVVLAPLKRGDEAMIEIQRAIELDPHEPTLKLVLANVLYFSRRFEEALAANAQVPSAYLPVRSAQDALCWAALDKPSKVESVIVAARGNEGAAVGQIAQMQRCMLAYAYAQEGKTVKAERIARDLEERSGYSYVSPCNRAAVQVALHHADEAIGLLNACYDQRDIFFRFLDVDPRYDPLRSDRRFHTLLQKAGLQ